MTGSTPRPTNRTLQELVRDKKFLLVASTGGHLAELEMVAKLLGPADSSVWATFDNAQSKSLLAERRHVFVPYVAPRDIKGTAVAYRRLVKLLRTEHFDGVLSTGAAVGVSAMLAGRRRRLTSAYVESLARLDSPSMTGKLVRRIPGVRTYTQYEGWSTPAWPHELSIMDSWRPGTRESGTPARIFVTLGTISPYRFDRLVDRLCEIVPANIEVRWQLGETRADGLHNAHGMLDAVQFAEAVDWADVVVSHAGVGNILSALNAGAATVVVPRRAVHDEHVDDHQSAFAKAMADRGLVFAREASDLTWQDLCEATRLAPEPMV